MSETKEIHMSDADAQEMKLYKKHITAETAYDVTMTEPEYNRTFNKYTVHRMDPRTATTVVASYYFESKEVASEAINHAKSRRG